jgi:hypothetical protein
MLAWFVLGGGDERQRRRAAISFDKIERAVRNIIILRAAQFMSVRKIRPRRYHPHKPTRIRLRAIAGVWLRRRLRTRGNLVTRALHLLAALRNWRDLGAELGRRRAGGLSRLARIWSAHACADPIAAAPLSALCTADTS